MPPMVLPTVVLHPCAAPAGRLRVWLGVFGRTAAPGVAWTLAGAPATPRVLRPLQSVRRGALLAGNPPRAFSGLFEFPAPGALAPGADVAVTARLDGDGGPVAALRLRPLPPEVPRGPGAAFKVLLASCFCAQEDREGLAGEGVAALAREERPDLLLLAGDQVYLDLPTLQDLPDDPAGLAERLEARYVETWASPRGAARILQAAPSVLTPDDHDYWNNAPQRVPWLPTTWTQAGRRAWHDAARAMFEGFQYRQDPAVAPFGLPVRLDVPPLSLLVLDTRSFRTSDFGRCLHPGALDAVRAWVDACVADRRLGVLVTGQSLLDPAAGEVRRKVGDAALADFGDFDDLWREVERLRAGAGDVLLLTGDVHFGRVARLIPTDGAAGAGSIYEVVSSPLALVGTPGVDLLKRLDAKAGDPWWRHPEPRPPPDLVAPPGVGRRYRTHWLHRQKGNHAALLTFRHFAAGLEVHFRFQPLKPGLAPLATRPFVLSPR